MTDTISENNFLFSLYYCYLVTEKINTLQEMSFIIYHIDIISCEEELWKNWISLQENKETAIKEFLHIKILNQSTCFRIQNLNCWKEREKQKRKKTENQE